MVDWQYFMEILPRKGCIIKTAGIDPSLFHILMVTAVIFESQEDAVDGILNDKVKAR